MLFGLFGLGKHRTKFGRFLDRHGISQIKVSRKSKLSNATLSKLCSDKTYRPRYSTMIDVIRALRKMGFDVHEGEFWDM